MSTQLESSSPSLDNLQIHDPASPSENFPSSPLPSITSFDESANLTHSRRKLFGKKISVVRMYGEDYLIGSQVASLLHRETFNMYRSMKVKDIPLIRANPSQVDLLIKEGAVKGGTHSVTLIPFDVSLRFIQEVNERRQRSEIVPTKKSPPPTESKKKISKKVDPLWALMIIANEILA